MNKNEMDKIFEEIDARIDSHREEIHARGAARQAEIQANFEKDCADIDANFAKYRKRDRIMNILTATCLVALGLMLLGSVLQGQTLESKNDACIEAGGVFVKVYGGFKCYSTDFRQELSIK